MLADLEDRRMALLPTGFQGVWFILWVSPDQAVDRPFQDDARPGLADQEGWQLALLNFPARFKLDSG